MKIFVVGTNLEDDLIQKYNAKSRESAQISVAAIKYSRLIKKGFEANLNDVDHVFLATFGMYPHCKEFFWLKNKIGNNKYIRFINIMVLKQITICLSLFLTLAKWFWKNRNEKCYVVFTSVYLPFIIAIIPFKIFNKIKFISFVPDLPLYSFSYSKSGGFLKKLLIPSYIFITNQLNLLIDFYVYITKYMTSAFPNKPYMIMEGLSDFVIDNAIVEKSAIKSVMYSGALYEKFGIKNLIDAFVKINGDYELWLFGTGDMADYATEVSKINSHVKYFGTQPNSEVLIYQKKATLLINPRFTDNEFTKFSFPSKLIEYLYSGTPVITTKLPGIPSDYDEFFYYAEDESIDGFKNTIQDCFSKNTEELSQFGAKGKQFVLEQKNYKVQIKKLIENLKILN